MSALPLPRSELSSTPSVKNNVDWIFLETCSTEALTRGLFNSRKTILIPDVFLVIFFFTLTTVSAIMDRIFLCLTIANGHKKVFLFHLTILLFTRIIIEMFTKFRTLYKKKRSISDLTLPSSTPWLVLRIIAWLVGFDTLLIAIIVLRHSLNVAKNVKINHASHDGTVSMFVADPATLSIIKSYCLITCVTKCIPQLYYMLTFLKDKDDRLCKEIMIPLLHYGTTKVIQDVGCSVLVASLIVCLNISTLSFTISITIPLRKKADVLKTTRWIPLIGLSKFMASMAFTMSHMTVLRISFKHLGLHCLLIEGLQTVITIAALVSKIIFKKNSFKKFINITYQLGLGLIYNFVYIHPVDHEGDQLYFLFYLLKFLADLCLIYMLGSYEAGAMIYVHMVAVSFGFLTASFGLRTLLLASIS